MVAKYEFDKLAEDISNDYVNNDVPLNSNIKIVSIKMNLNPEQIKRLTEATNIKTYNKMYDKAEDKTFKFDLGDSKKVIDEVYSDDTKSNTEIKDMPEVQYKPEKNPKNPQVDYEILGDQDEAEVSKNVINDEDSAGDTMLDALKVPKKDYAYSENTIEDNYDDGSESQVIEEEDRNKLSKEAALETFEAIGRELDHRDMLLSTRILDETKKVASMFNGLDGHKKFAELVRHASAIYRGNRHLPEALDLVVKEARIDTSIPVTNRPLKYASHETHGMDKFAYLMDALEVYGKTMDAKELVQKEIL